MRNLLSGSSEQRNLAWLLRGHNDKIFFFNHSTTTEFSRRSANYTANPHIYIQVLKGRPKQSFGENLLKIENNCDSFRVKSGCHFYQELCRRDPVPELILYRFPLNAIPTLIDCEGLKMLVYSSITAGKGPSLYFYSLN